MYLKEEDGEEGEDEESEGSQEGSHRHLLHVFFCNAHLGINLPSFRL